MKQHSKWHKTKIFLLIVALLTVIYLDKNGSWNRAGVRGRVVDVFGHPLSNVAVRLKGQDVTTITDDDGLYRLNPDSGRHTMLFSKLGYTSEQSPLFFRKRGKTLATKILYPIPQESGMFYVAPDSLLPLPTQTLQKISTQNMQLHAADVKFVLPDSIPLAIPADSAIFIDTEPDGKWFARLTPAGTVKHVSTHYSFGEKTIFSGIQREVKSRQVGLQKLRIWKLHLKPGLYAWIGHDEASNRKSSLRSGLQAFVFQVQTKGVSPNLYTRKD